MRGDLGVQLGTAMSSLGDITSRGTETVGNASYGRIYIRPRASLGSALLSSKEILVIVTPYPELQTRVVDAVEKAHRVASGRLERNLAIVAHAVSGQNEVILNWGRERGLTLLPVDCSSGVPTGSDLQDAICSSLYSQDPFDLTGPVRSVQQFFGRPHLPDIARRLRDGQVFSLFGIRKVGKTSVLNRLANELVESGQAACIVVDGSDDALSGLRAGELLTSIADSVRLALATDGYAKVLPIGGCSSPADGSASLLKGIQASGVPLVLFVDEVDYLSPSSPTQKHWRTDFNVFFRALRQVYQETARRGIPFSIMLCGVSSYWFSVDEVDGVENAALAFVPENYLSPLERSESVQMIQSLGRAAGLTLDDGAADEVAMTCSDMPFWIRRAGSYIHSCYDQSCRPVRIHRNDAVVLMGEFVDVEGAQLALSSLRNLFRIYPELGSTAVDSVRHRNLETLSQPLLSALGRYAILGEGFGASGPMMAAGIDLWEASLASSSANATRVADQNGQTIAAGSTSPAGDDEWLSLLSEVNHLRNRVERDLRDLVLLVVRSECRDHPNLTAKEVLLKAIEPERRATIDDSGLRTILRQFYWKDLVNLVNRRWTWFEPTFRDKPRFGVYGDVLNARPDAHAKEIDAGDLALQRLASDWIQERIRGSGLM